MRSSLACLLWFVSSAAGLPAEELKSATSHITEVTVYQNSAMVRRRVDIPAGLDQELSLGTLPKQAMLHTISGEGTEQIEVRGVRVTARDSQSMATDEFNQLRATVLQLTKQKAELEAKAGTIHKKIAYIDHLMSFSAATTQTDLNRGVLNAQTLTELSDYTMEQLSALNEQLLNLTENISEVDDQLTTARSKLEDISSQVDRTYDTTLLITNPTGLAGQVYVSYLVGGCGWVPQYSIYGQADSAEVSIKCGAAVEQSSGEDWTNVRLSFSTASPDKNTTSPVLTPFRVRAYDDGVDNPLAVMQEAEDELQMYADVAGDSLVAGEEIELALNKVASAVQNMELQMDTNQLRSLASDASDDIASQTFKIDAPITLSSRREQQFVQLATTKLQGELYYVATPLLSSYAHLEADVVNQRSESLLGGAAKVYWNGEFVGRTQIPTVATGQYLLVGFGADAQIRTRRELVDKQDEVQGGNRQLTLAYKLVIANFKNQPIQVRLYDRIPDAGRSSDVKTQMAQSKTELSTDGQYLRLQKSRGIMRWDVAVPGDSIRDKAFDVEYQVTVAFDRNRTVALLSDDDAAAGMMDDQQKLRGMGGMGGTGGMGGGMFRDDPFKESDKRPVDPYSQF